MTPCALPRWTINQRLQDQLAESERERRRLEAEATQPETGPDPTSGSDTDAETEAEVPNPYNIPSEWVWHNGQYIPLDEVPVTIPEPEPPAGSIYLAWDYHGRPELHDLGSWADGSMVSRDIGHVEFGIGMRGGQYVPWLRGGLPERSLYGNNEVRRTYDEYGYWTVEYSDFRWNGELVGITPAGRHVTGKATLSDFDFGGHQHRGKGPDRLRHWDPGKAYLEFTNLAYHDGTTWGDGDLEYEVGIGRTFAGGGSSTLNHSFSHPFRRFDCTRSSTGCANDSPSIAAGVRREGYWSADEGEIRGMFFGPGHEAMAGTLERNDLTAAFGGTR